MFGLKAWFAPIVPPPSTADDPETSWVEVDPLGNPQVRRWTRPKHNDPWNTDHLTVYGKSLLGFLPLVVIPLVLGFWRLGGNGERTCYRIPETGRRVCRTEHFRYAFGQMVLIASGFYFLFFMVLEMVLMAHKRLHPWMYICTYTLAAVFPAVMFPIDPHGPWKYTTIVFAAVEWGFCGACVAHGVVVSRRLARERRVRGQLDEDARLAEELFQEGEREERELGVYRDDVEEGLEDSVEVDVEAIVSLQDAEVTEVSGVAEEQVFRDGDGEE